MTLMTGKADASGQANDGATPPAGGPPAGSPPATSTSGATQTWKDSLPDDIKGHNSLANFQDVSALAKSYIHAQAAISKKGVIVPGADAGEQDWESFYNSIGRPSVDKFDLKLPDGKEVNKPLIDEFKTMAHKAGLLPKQAQAIMQWHMDGEEKALASSKETQALKVKEGVESLKKEWGDGYNKQISLARMAVEKLGGEPFQKYLEETGLGNDPMLIKHLASAGKLLGEDKLRGDGSGKFGQTPAEVDAELQSVMGLDAYKNPRHADHAKVMLKFEDLAKKKWGT